MTIDQNHPQHDALLSQLQGNILKGHGRDHTANIFLEFHDSQQDEVRVWLADFSSAMVTTAKQQLAENERFKRHQVPGGLFAGIYLAAAGYEYLAVPDEQWPVDNADTFARGMNDAQITLNDTVPAEWDPTFQDINIHAMVLLAHDDKLVLSKAVAGLIGEIRGLTMDVAPPAPAPAPFLSSQIRIEYGNAIRNANGDGLEHFGYVDGISQPLFFTDEVKKDAKHPVPAGDLGAAPDWNPEADVALVLVDDYAGSVNQGSFYVFRKLAQDVRGFKAAEHALANDLHMSGEDQELAGALLVGRFEDGTPVAVSHSGGMIGSGRANNFNYDQDRDGSRCPFQSHVRKSNPRGAERVLGGILQPASPGMLAHDKGRIMARRGIPYGLREVSTEFDCQPEQFPVGGDVGLLFQSFQADIGEQFEFIQQRWVNDADFPFPGPPPTGIDPLIGQSAGGAGREYVWPVNGSAHPQPLAFAQFVTLRGGEYFYAPSVATLLEIANLPGNAPGNGAGGAP